MLNFEIGQKFGTYLKTSNVLQFMEIVNITENTILVQWKEDDGSNIGDPIDLKLFDIIKIDNKSFNIHGIIICILVKTKCDELALKIKIASKE